MARLLGQNASRIDDWSPFDLAVETRIRRKHVTDREYTNPFEDVHKKAKALKDHMLDVKKNDTELRESGSARDAKEILDKEHD